MGVTKFHQYLCGLAKPFTLVTDHKPLIKLFGQHESLPEMASGRIRRWALKLSNYNYIIQFRRTNEIANADALSRLPSPEEAGASQEELVLLVEPDWLDAKDMARLTSRDVLLSQVLKYVQSGCWPSKVTDGLRSLVSKRNELSLTAGVLLWGHRVVVPEAARRMVLQELHVGHPGIVRMKAAARSVVWWPGIDDDIERVVNLCRPCQESRCSPQRAELHMWPWAARPWSRLHLDFAELTKCQCGAPSGRPVLSCCAVIGCPRRPGHVTWRPAGPAVRRGQGQ